MEGSDRAILSGLVTCCDLGNKKNLLNHDRADLFDFNAKTENRSRGIRQNQESVSESDLLSVGAD